MKKRLQLCVTLICILFLTITGLAQEVRPPHVYQAVTQTLHDIGLIREVMGRPVLDAPPWVVVHAEPRHVYYQIRTMFRKVSRLLEQTTGEQITVPPFTESEEIEPHHVLKIVQGAQSGIEKIRAELGISYRAELPPLDNERQPRDVLREVEQANRQLNLMLDKPILPEDVYGRLELAATYVAGALTTDESEPVYGTLPPFHSGKMPEDVYRRVLACLSIAQEIGRLQGIAVLDVNWRRELRRRDIAPSDVYDVATTLLAEIAYLTLRLDGLYVDLLPIERPKHIFPSHVYQMATMLQNELAQLQEKLQG